MQLKYQLVVSLAVLCLSFFSLKAQNISGSWSGNIEMPNAKLNMVFNISEDDNGKLSAKLDVPQQGASNLPVGEVVIKSDSLFLKVPAIMGNFEGKFISADSLAGKWVQVGQKFPLNLKRTGALKKVLRPQTPKAPFSYSSEEVEYINPESGFKLAGTLTIPANANNCAGVVLITGSSAQDRDETIYDHKPFWVIADYFANNGIAVLRVDDRGVGGSEGNITDATSADFATDVLCGVEYLSRRKEIDAAKIGLIGHSEGGLIAPIAANQSEKVAFFIMMAGVGIPGDSLLLEQSALIGKASGLHKDAVNANLFMMKGMINILKTELKSEERTMKLKNVISRGSYNMLDDDRKRLIDKEVKRIDNKWFSYLVAYDPRPELKKVKCPVLALNGEKDLQVPPGSNLPAIEKAIKEGGNKNVLTMELPNLNHLFQTCESGSPQEYSQIEETISPTVLEIMKNWILKISTK